MSAERLPQVAQDEPQIGGWPIGVPLPLVMTPAQLRQVFQIGESRYFELKSLGRFKCFEAPDLVGPTRYSGEKVRDFLRHEAAQPRTFGGRRSRRAPAQTVSKAHAPQSDGRTTTAQPNSLAPQQGCRGQR